MTSSKPTAQSATERRAAEAELQALLTKHAPEYVRLINAVRKSLRKRLPTAHEVVYEYRDFVVISLSPSEHGYEGVLALRASADDAKLYFNRAKDLPDPERLLKGSAQARWITLESPSTLTRPAVATLIDEAIAQSRVPFPRSGNGSMAIRSTAATKSQRPASNKKALQPARRRARSRKKSG